MNTLLDKMSADAGTKEDLLKKVRDTDLDGIARLAETATALENKIAILEKKIKEEKSSLREIIENDLPNALEAVGVEKFTLLDGSEISVQAAYFASIPKSRQEEAFEWLQDNQYDDIIKNIVSVKFGRGENEQASFLIGKIGEAGFAATQTFKVEPMTLKAWLRERVEQSDAVPFDLFGAYISNRATINRSRK